MAMSQVPLGSEYVMLGSGESVLSPLEGAQQISSGDYILIVFSYIHVSLVVTDCRRHLSSRHPIRTILEDRTKGSYPALIPIVTARSPGVRPGLSKGRYGHTTLRVPLLVPRDERITFFEIPSHPHPYTSTYSPAHREKMEMEGVSNKLLSEVALDQPARTTLYTTLCGN
ncbi:hypothetical protein YC2023_071129 [Brassica napus]